MARGGNKKPTHLRAVTGGKPGQGPRSPATQQKIRTGPLEPPKKLTKAQARLWKRFIDTAHWLTDHDAPKAHMWVSLQSEFLANPKDMQAARATQLRLLGGELGLDPGARARLGISTQDENENDEFFD